MEIGRNQGRITSATTFDHIMMDQTYLSGTSIGSFTVRTYIIAAYQIMY